MKRKDIMIIALTIFLTIIVWVGVEIKSISDKTPTDNQIENIETNYQIDTELLDLLDKRT